MNRLVPVLIVATVLALGATVAADHPVAPVPAAAITKHENTYRVRHSGKRICLICKRERDRRRRGAG